MSLKNAISNTSPAADIVSEQDFIEKEIAPIESTGYWPSQDISPLGFDPRGVRPGAD